MKRIVWSSVGLVFGVLMIVGAAFALFDDTVTCGGKTMREGDVCVREKNGTVVSESNLDESKTEGTVGKIVGIAFGVVFTAVGAVNLRLGLRNRKAAAYARHPEVLNQLGVVNHPAPGPWNQAPGGPQARPQYQPPRYQPQQYQQPQYHQPPQHGWQQQAPYQPPAQRQYPPSGQGGGTWH